MPRRKFYCEFCSSVFDTEWAKIGHSTTEHSDLNAIVTTIQTDIENGGRLTNLTQWEINEILQFDQSENHFADIKWPETTLDIRYSITFTLDIRYMIYRNPEKTYILELRVKVQVAKIMRLEYVQQVIKIS